MTKQEVAALQREINKTTSFQIKEDGIYGPKTAEAYQGYINQRTPFSVTTPVPPAPVPWYLSRSVIGLLATIIAGVASKSGWLVDAGELTNVLMQVVEVGGLALALFGTIKRRAPLDFSVVLPGIRPKSTPPLPPSGKSDNGEPFVY